MFLHNRLSCFPISMQIAKEREREIIGKEERVGIGIKKKNEKELLRPHSIKLRIFRLLTLHLSIAVCCEPFFLVEFIKLNSKFFLVFSHAMCSFSI